MISQEHHWKQLLKKKSRLESLHLMQWLDKFIKPRKENNNLEAETENSDPEIDINSKDNNNITPDLSD